MSHHLSAVFRPAILRQRLLFFECRRDLVSSMEEQALSSRAHAGGGTKACSVASYFHSESAQNRLRAGEREPNNRARSSCK